MLALKICIAVVGFALSLFLFRKAASTIDIGKINVISYIMYLFLAQTMIGASLVYFGDHNHYTMGYVLNESSFDIMYYSVLMTAILFPVTILVVHKLLRFNMKQAYAGYLQKETIVLTQRKVFWVIVGVGGACVLFLGIYILKIGYLPLLRILLPVPSDFNMSVERQEIGRIVILNSQLTNLTIGLFLPLVSYVSFAYAWVLKKSPRWWIVTILLIGACIVGETIDFEKSPVIFYLFVLILIVIYIRGGIPRPIVWGFVGIMVLYILFIYGRNGFDFSQGIDIYNGPIGRILFTQVGTLVMHFDMFPAIMPFLGGRSFSPTFQNFLGIEGSSVRSAKIVMDFYGSDKVYNGTGGVMNTLFIGEAYANFGYVGMVLSVIYVAALMALFVFAFLKLRKTPFNIAMFAFLTSRFAQTTQGGFTDFVYNLQFILVILLTIGVNFLPRLWNKYIGPRIQKRKSGMQEGGTS